MIDRAKLDMLYHSYNHRKFVHPDPLEFLYDFPDPLDREIVGLTASSLAYGRVAQILKSVSKVLERMPEPGQFLHDSSRDNLQRTFQDFKHRFTSGEELASMLYGAGRVIRRYGSIGNCFMAGMSDTDENILPGLCHLVDEISHEAGSELSFLLPHPSRKSACKRLNLFLRWMVREDDVDPGGWKDVSPSMLLVPLDVHMHRICRSPGITDRKQADLRTVIEVTDFFRKINPNDPVKYDFALTRFGIRDELDDKAFIEKCLMAGTGSLQDQAYA